MAKIEQFELNNSEIGPSATRIAIAIGVFGLLSVFYLGTNVVFILWIGFLLAVLVRDLIQDRQRTRLIRDFASRTGFSSLGACLPKSFPMLDTSSGWARSVIRAFAGDKNNREVLVFDCWVGHGKGSFRRTVVAVRGKSADFGWARFGPGPETLEVGGWAVVYGSKRLLGLGEIAELIAEL